MIPDPAPAGGQAPSGAPAKRAAHIPLLCALLGHVLWGVSFLFTKVALSSASPNALLSLRFLLSVLIMSVPVLLGRARISFRGKNWKPLLLLCAMQLAYYCFESYCLIYTNATITGVVLAVVPVAAILLAAVFLREYPPKRQAFFCLLPVAGVVIMTAAGRSLGIIQPIGLLFLLGACLASAAYKTANRKAGREFTSFERSYFVLAGAAVAFTVLALREAGWDLPRYLAPLTDLRFVGAVLALSVLCSISANLLVNYAASRMPVAELSSFGAISTLCSMSVGVIFLREPLTPSLLLGAALILYGVYQVTRKN